MDTTSALALFIGLFALIVSIYKIKPKIKVSLMREITKETDITNETNRYILQIQTVENLSGKAVLIRFVPLDNKCKTQYGVFILPRDLKVGNINIDTEFKGLGENGYFEITQDNWLYTYRKRVQFSEEPPLTKRIPIMIRQLLSTAWYYGVQYKPHIKI